MDQRFDRHAHIPGWRQELLAAATVVIAGAGAVGNELARMLGMAGVGKLLIADFDDVAESNLSRCTLFTEADIGLPKVDALRKNLLKLAPHTQVDARNKEFRQAVGLAEIRDANLVMSCVDSNAARIELAARCRLVNAPYIDGGTNPWGGEIRLFLDPAGPCYACYAGNNMKRGQAEIPQSCAPPLSAPVSGSAIIMTSLVAAWMADFALRHLMGLKNPAGILRINGETGCSQWVEGKKNKNCLYHLPLGRKPVKTEVTNTATVAQLLAAVAPANPLLWHPMPVGKTCRHCGAWLPMGTDDQSCSSCGSTEKEFVLKKEYELSFFNKEERLENLGIPPGEILSCSDRQLTRFIELAY